MESEFYKSTCLHHNDAERQRVKCPICEINQLQNQLGAQKERMGLALEELRESNHSIAMGDFFMPVKCGSNPVFGSMRVGCGLEISHSSEVYRCCDCQTPFHKACLHKHCADELTTVKTALRNLRNECVRLDAECEAGSGNGCGVDGSFLDAAAKALNPNQQSKSEMDGAE